MTEPTTNPDEERPQDADEWEHRDVLGYVRHEIESMEGQG